MQFVSGYVFLCPCVLLSLLVVNNWPGLIDFTCVIFPCSQSHSCVQSVNLPAVCIYNPQHPLCLHRMSRSGSLNLLCTVAVLVWIQMVFAAVHPYHLVIIICYLHLPYFV